MSATQWLDLFNQVVQQLPITLIMIICALILATILGLILTIIRIKQVPYLSTCVRIYQSFMRSTHHFDRLFFIILAFSLHSAAYLSEVFRAGYLSVDYRQIEAGLSVGLSYPRILKDIIIPQALRNSIPNLTTQIIELIKDTSLAFTIGIIDMMGQVQLIIGNNYGLGMLEVYIVISIIYWLLALIIQGTFTIISKISEKPYQV
ncbi:ABC amino acid transporter, permease component [Mycobacteroides abscessus subsp. abscessus]|nr:ABC amino acid transporter, permease component [Mycobacteroides abscessus subsp. abscessus]